jgi:hypothetical protein
MSEPALGKSSSEPARPKRRGRPPKHERPMTGAERVSKFRAHAQVERNALALPVTKQKSDCNDKSPEAADYTWEQIQKSAVPILVRARNAGIGAAIGGGIGAAAGVGYCSASVNYCTSSGHEQARSFPLFGIGIGAAIGGLVIPPSAAFRVIYRAR